MIMLSVMCTLSDVLKQMNEYDEKVVLLNVSSRRSAVKSHERYVSSQDSDLQASTEFVRPNHHPMGNETQCGSGNLQDVHPGSTGFTSLSNNSSEPSPKAGVSPKKPFYGPSSSALSGTLGPTEKIEFPVLVGMSPKRTQRRSQKQALVASPVARRKESIASSGSSSPPNPVPLKSSSKPIKATKPILINKSKSASDDGCREDVVARTKSNDMPHAERTCVDIGQSGSVPANSWALPGSQLAAHYFHG